jgi:DMSO reductase iron-sulfur subunit
VANSFVFDPNRCTGCAACRLACTIENDLLPGQSWRRIETFNERHRPDLPLYHLSLACNHCEQAACMHACPALAYSRDPTTGAVLLDEDKCIGCKYCSWACPFDAPLFDTDQGVMTKCTFCNERIKDGLQPACVALCPTGALGFDDLDAARTVQHVDAFPRTGLGPRVRIEPIRDERQIPSMHATGASVAFAEAPPERGSGISLRSEWSLMAFTLLASTLVAVVATAATTSSPIDARAFAVAAAVTMGLASAHLGRKSRAWRAVLNLRRSWLSREIVSLSVFFGAATAWLAIAPGDGRAGIATALVGFLGLFCADQVYGVLRRSGPGHRHSASVLWTGFFLTGIFSGAGWLAVAVGFGRLGLYCLRKLQFRQSNRPTSPTLGIFRVTLGFLVPLGLWVFALPDARPLIIACVLAGEAIDRAEYYLELERETPRRRMADILLRLAPGSSWTGL